MCRVSILYGYIQYYMDRNMIETRCPNALVEHKCHRGKLNRVAEPPGHMTGKRHTNVLEIGEMISFGKQHLGITSTTHPHRGILKWCNNQFC